VAGDRPSGTSRVGQVEAGHVAAEREVRLAAERVEHGAHLEALAERAGRAHEPRLTVGAAAEPLAHVEHRQAGRRLVGHRVCQLDLVVGEAARPLRHQRHDPLHRPVEGQRHVEDALRLEALDQLARDERRCPRVRHVERLAGDHDALTAARPVERQDVLRLGNRSVRGRHEAGAVRGVGGHAQHMHLVHAERFEQLAREAAEDRVRVHGGERRERQAAYRRERGGCGRRRRGDWRRIAHHVPVERYRGCRRPT
jgi:hypothetical protein